MCVWERGRERKRADRPKEGESAGVRELEGGRRERGEERDRETKRAGGREID